MKVLFVTGITLAVLFGLCLLPLKIRIYLLQEGTSIKGKLVLRILGFLGWTFKFSPGKAKQQEHENTRIERKKRKVRNNLPPPGRLLDFGRVFVQINIWLIEHIKCTRFIWKTSLGIGDAAATGIGGGFLWAVKGILLCIMKKTVSGENCKIEIDVTPVFDRETIKTEFDCIFHLRTGYIIIACIRLFVLGFVFNLVPKGEKLSEQPSN